MLRQCLLLILVPLTKVQVIYLAIAICYDKFLENIPIYELNYGIVLVENTFVSLILCLTIIFRRIYMCVQNS